MAIFGEKNFASIFYVQRSVLLNAYMEVYSSHLQLSNIYCVLYKTFDDDCKLEGEYWHKSKYHLEVLQLTRLDCIKSALLEKIIKCKMGSSICQLLQYIPFPKDHLIPFSFQLYPCEFGYAFIRLTFNEVYMLLANIK